jgi:hypothetical protein
VLQLLFDDIRLENVDDADEQHIAVSSVIKGDNSTLRVSFQERDHLDETGKGYPS